MRKKKAVSLAIIMAMTLGLAGCGSRSGSSDSIEANAPASEAIEEAVEEDKEEITTETAGDADDMFGDVLKTGEKEDADKDETVYVITDANGNKNNVIVSEWLKNKDHADVIEDVSTLSDIENVKGDEEFTQNGDRISWKAGGNPIYYQGKTDKEIPVEVKVTYFLDGAEVTPEQIAGKSGNVRMRFEYINKAKNDGIYVPFIMATGFFLDNANFSNIEVTNGKYISDGSKSVVLGFGIPGLKDDLGATTEKVGVKIPDYFEVTADTTNFKLDMTLTVAATGLVGDTIENVDFSAIEGEISKLVDEYHEGVNKLAAGIVSYTDGVSKLSGGASQVSSGADQLADGASKISSGTDRLYAGGVTLSNALESADIGSGQLKAAFEGENGVLAGSSKLSNGLQQLNGAVQEISLPEIPNASDISFTDEQKAAAAKAISEAAEKELAEQGITLKTEDLEALSGMKDDEKVRYITEKAAAAAKEDPNVKKIMASDEVQGLIANTVNGIIEQKTDEYMASEEGSAVYEAKVKEFYDTMVKAIMGDASDPSELARYAVAGAGAQGAVAQYTAANPDAQQIPVKAVSGALAYNEVIYNQLLAAFNNGFSANDEMIRAMVKPAVREGVKANIEANYKEKITTEVTNGYIQLVGNAFAAGYGNAYSELGKEMQDIAGKMEYIISVYTNKGVEYGIDQALTMVKEEMNAFAPKIASLKDGVAQLAGGSAQLDGGLNKVYNGVKSLDDGLDKIYASVPTLTNGLAELSNGAGTLNSGARELSGGASTLASGAAELDSHSNELVDGSSKLKDATDMITGKFGDAKKDLDVISEEVKKVIEAGREYDNFAGLSDDMTGNVKFIIKTAEISAEE